MSAARFEVWKDTESGKTYKVNSFPTWNDAADWISANEKFYPGWHLRIVEKFTRKVVFKIDDIAYFKKMYAFTEEQMQEIFATITPFRAIYTLYGNGKDIRNYTLTDYDGNKISVNSLNGYVRGTILSDCMAYFWGMKYHDENATEPFGVISIEDTEISE